MTNKTFRPMDQSDPGTCSRNCQCAQCGRVQRLSAMYVNEQPVGESGIGFYYYCGPCAGAGICDSRRVGK